MSLEYVPRAAWQGPRPITGPMFPRWLNIRALVLHHVGASRIGDDTAAVLRSIHEAWLNDPARGYSFGYSWAVDRRGVVWQGRGWDYRQAATLGRDGRTNNYTAAILALTSEGEPATPAMAAGIAAVCADARRLAARPAANLPLEPHHAFAGTACPGPILTAQLRTGELERLTTPTTIDLGDDDMTTLRRYRDRRYHNVWLLPSGVHLSGELDKSYAADGVPLVEDQHDQTLVSLLHLSGLPREGLVAR